MNVSLPDKMKDWIEAQVETGRYANSSDVVRDLIRKERGEGRLPVSVRQAVAAALAAREDADQFVPHDEAMAWLDEVIIRAAGGQRS